MFETYQYPDDASHFTLSGVLKPSIVFTVAMVVLNNRLDMPSPNIYRPMPLMPCRSPSDRGDIAAIKMADLSANDIEAAARFGRNGHLVVPLWLQ